MEGLTVHFTCKYCGHTAPLANAITPYNWTPSGNDITDFLAVHGCCQVLEARGYDASPFLLTYTATKEQGEVRKADLPMTDEQLAFLESLRDKK